MKDSFTTMISTPSSLLESNPLPDFTIVFKDNSTDGTIDLSCYEDSGKTTTVVDSVGLSRNSPESILRQILLTCLSVQPSELRMTAAQDEEMRSVFR
jgi:hypothetical protein